ncbi:DUF2795 domain-containing protein [Klenkia brasiliensis]|uniref:DUF2795 domain-containing protein n=1 Tax=Klenkia brasiliensis TaxID=333142 RepID=A0A1G7QQE8_9ACTN|nr:DUF2795 domain-containing protein [Klenkia brasiliensis]SDG00694.1 Protein of unknown function [Klenkia brasiliensis]
MTGPGEDRQTSATHGARVDDVLAAEVEPITRTGHSGRSEESREVEPSGEDQPDVDLAPDGTLTGGTPVGIDQATVQLRTELARWLDRADFPATGADLVEAARDHRAPDAVADELARLEPTRSYDRVGEVVRALGHPTEG